MKKDSILPHLGRQRTHLNASIDMMLGYMATGDKKYAAIHLQDAVDFGEALLESLDQLQDEE